MNHAVESGSFAGAARLLDVSTPAVTPLIAALESELGVVLLHRSPQGLALTWLTTSNPFLNPIP